MILSAQSIRTRVVCEGMINPFHLRTRFKGLTFGLSPAGYDIRIAQDVELVCGGFVLASSLEHFNIPFDVLANVADKSTWARRGVCVQNTILEPGWRGYLTLELTKHSPGIIKIECGMAIAQVIFYQLDEPTAQPYEGKYQNQINGVVPAKDDI